MPEVNNTIKVDADEDEKQRIERFRQDLFDSADVHTEQREQANDDMRFINVRGAQWEDFLEADFADRAKLEFDITSPYLNRYMGNWNLNRIGVEFKPDDSKSSDEDAELINGIYRIDFREGSGKMAVDNAVQEAATCGYGAYKMATRFVDEEDPENEFQRIEFRPIYNAYNSVFWDLQSQRIDKRDARFCNVLTLMTSKSFKDRYGDDKKPVSVFEPTTLRRFSFFSLHIEMIHIGTRYEVIKERVKVFVYRNLASGQMEVYSDEEHKEIKGQLKDDPNKQFVRERKILKQHVEKTVFSGDDILEETKRIAGKWIPIVPMYGYRSYVDGVEWYYGLVAKMKDANRLFNMHLSQLAENSASSGQEVPIFDPDQMIGNLGDIWANKNNKAWLPAASLRNDKGDIVQSGPVGYSKPAQVDPSTVASINLVTQFTQQITGGAPQDTIDPNASGKAINATNRREDLKTQTITDNTASSQEWGGEIYQAMAQDVYTVKRIIRTLGEDGAQGTKQLLQVVVDEKTGKQIQANDLRGKKFRVYADAAPQYDSMREQTVEDLKGMLDALSDIPSGQQYIPAILATILENMVGAGLSPLKKLNRQNMIVMGLVEPETDEEKQMLAQAQQPKEDPNQKLIEAATVQALSEARNLDSASLEKASSARLKDATTVKTIAEARQIGSDVELDRVKTLADIRQKNIDNLKDLPINQVN